MGEGGNSATGAGITQWVSIAGNIKQQYLPFVLKPGSNINHNVNGDRELTDGPQFFSFRNKDASKYSAGFGRLNICPSVMKTPDFGMLFNKDISNRLLYDYDTKAKITIDSFFNMLPGVQIREFQVDSKLDQFLNLFYDIFKSVGGNIGEMFKGGWDAIKEKASELSDALMTAKQFLCSEGPFVSGPNLMVDANGNNRWETAATAA